MGAGRDDSSTLIEVIVGYGLQGEPCGWSEYQTLLVRIDVSLNDYEM